jgi:hypothetical protein
LKFWSFEEREDDGSRANIKSIAEDSLDFIPEKYVFAERGVRMADQTYDT